MRTHSMRLTFIEGRNVTSDYALLEKATSFMANMTRPRGWMTIVLRGQGRFEEGSRRKFLETGDVVVSNCVRHGSEAHTGVVNRQLIVEWEPQVGNQPPNVFTVERLGA